MSLIRVKLLETVQNDQKPVVSDGVPLLDEVVFQNVELHIEQMTTESYWIGVTDAQQNHWHFNIGLSADAPHGVEMVCTDHPGEETGQPFPPPALTDQPYFTEETPPELPQRNEPWSYHPQTDSYHWRGYAIKPKNTPNDMKSLHRPSGDQINESKYLEFLVETAQDDWAAPKDSPDC